MKREEGEEEELGKGEEGEARKKRGNMVKGEEEKEEEHGKRAGR